MYASDYVEEKYLNTLKGTIFTASQKNYLALFIGNPTKGGIEVSYTGYKRIEMAWNTPAPDTNFQNKITIKNTTDATFAESPIDAGTISHLVLFDGATAGNQLFYGELETPISILSGKSAHIIPNEIIWYLESDMSPTVGVQLFNILNGISIEGVTPFVGLLNNGVELSASGYERFPIGDLSIPTESSSGKRRIYNVNAIIAPRASSNWGIVTGAGIFDSKNNGSLLWSKDFENPITIPRLETLVYKPNSLGIGVN